MNSPLPTLPQQAQEARVDDVLRIERLTVEFANRSSRRNKDTSILRAVDEVDLTVYAGETLGVVGESGCGKSTLARAIVGLVRPTSGRVLIGGDDVGRARGHVLRQLRRRVQMVFQDSYSSFDPRQTIADSIAEPLRNFGVFGSNRRKYRERTYELLQLVHLDESIGRSFPSQLSGGQRQRAAVARALALEPRLLVLDEPVSALDVSLQAGLINLLEDLQHKLGVAYVFIAHDLAVVRQISHRVAVMYLGAVAEVGPTENIFDRPLHPYTSALLDAVPITDPDDRHTLRTRIILRGDVQSTAQTVGGCRFRARCFKAQSLCADIEPPLEAKQTADHRAACHFPMSDRPTVSSTRE
jgi:oligopeptide/dipeptide ABC transporter ATP-binding protein